MAHPDQPMFVFDLDGVVTNPETNTVSTKVIQHVITELGHHRPVAFNTGRPYEWVEEHIMPQLQAATASQDLDHLLIVAEMGGVLCVFHNGRQQLELDQTLSLPGPFIKDIEHLLAQPRTGAERYADYVWWDGLKKTMGSLVKWDHVSINDFNQVRPSLETDLRALMAQHHLEDFIIGQTTIATDIQHRTAGKHKGAQQILGWLKVCNLTPDTFYTFGDSISDKAMAEEFAATGTDTVFIFVGDPAHKPEITNPVYKTVVMQGRHSQDTADYLAKLNS